MVNVVFIRIVLSYLSLELAGTWFLFVSIGMYLAYLDLGISPTVSREISFVLGRGELSADEKDAEIAGIIATCLRMFQVISLTVLMAGLLVGWLYLPHVVPPADMDQATMAWLVFNMGAALNVLGGAAFVSLYGMGNIATEKIIRSFTLLGGLALSVTFLKLGLGMVGLAIAWLVQNLIARLAGWVMLYRQNPGLRGHKARPSMEVFRRITIPSLKWAGISLGALLLFQTDNPIIAGIFGPAHIAPYEAVAKIGFALLTFSILTVHSSIPFISQAYAAGDSAGLERLLMRNVRYGMSIMMILVSFFAFFGQSVINVWIGEGNFVGYPVLLALLAALTLEVHHAIHSSAVMGAGKIVFIRITLISGGLKLFLSLMLALRYGIWGVPVGTCIAILATNLWYSLRVSLGVFHISLKSYIINAVLPLMGLGAALLLGGLAARSVLAGSNDILSIMGGMTMLFSVGTAVTWGLLMTDNEKRRIIEKLRGFVSS